MSNYPEAVDLLSIVRHCREQRARSAMMRAVTRRANAHGAAMRVWAERMKARAGAYRGTDPNSAMVLPRS
jgi:hypothetical protein